MRMLRWGLGLTRKDRVRNDKVTEIMKVAPLQEKLREEDCGGLGMHNEETRTMWGREWRRWRWAEGSREDQKEG